MMVKAETTLENLVSMGRCNCLNVKDYTEQLKQLAMSQADKEEAKKRGRFFKALGDETRQRMLGLLMARDTMCVCELMTALNMTQPTTSHHLRILSEAELIKSNKEGKWVFYSVTDKKRISTLLENSY